MSEVICVNNKPFDVVRLLGRGKGGYSYLVTDGIRQFVLKQIHHEPCSYYNFGDKLQSELRDYRRLRDVGMPLPQLIDCDVANERILKQFVDGPTVFDLVREGCQTQVDRLILQMKELCKILYSAGLNVDYFPTNFVVDGGKLIYVDYECNTYMDEWNFENWGIKYWSRTQEFLQYVAEN